ncbi:unnamed protein product [Effrenium voratum]|nr:unnamed protein product [Effrenium voratum]
MEGAVRQFSRDCSGHAMLALEPPSHTRSAYWRPYAGERCTTRWSHDGHDHTARSVTCAACAAFARQCARNPRHEGKVRVEAKGASDLRQGFKVNTKYRGAASYGTISQEEMEEAERIRNQYTTDLSSIKKADVQPARKRLLLKRLKPGFAAGSRTKRLVQVVQHRQESEAEVEAEEEAEAEEPNVAETGSERSSEPGSREAFLPGLADTANLTSSLQSWEGWAPAMDLAGARRVAAAPRSAAASALKAAARALSAADEHELCAQVLLELRDFGVDREVLERRLSPAAANALFEETALRLGLALRDAGQRQDAWEALMAVCAQPALGQHLRKPSLQALAEVSERLANATSDPYLQVQYLQGVLDAEVVLQALPRDRREGLELYLALSMEKTGQEQESRQILTRLARKGTSRRRKQAEWAILVQDAEVEDDGAQSAEMKGIWNEVQLPSSSRLGGAGAAARRQASGASSFGLPGGGAAVLAVALLALPLALPLLLLGHSDWKGPDGLTLQKIGRVFGAEKTMLPLLEELRRLEAEQEENEDRSSPRYWRSKGRGVVQQRRLRGNGSCRKTCDAWRSLKIEQMIITDTHQLLQRAEQQELKADQMVIAEQRRLSNAAAKPKEIFGGSFAAYYSAHIHAWAPSQMPRLYAGFHHRPLGFLPLKHAGQDSARSGTESASSGKPLCSARSAHSTAASVTEDGHSGRLSLPKLVLPRPLSGRHLDSRQRKTRDALQKLAAAYSVPISRSMPSLHKGKEDLKEQEKLRPPRPPRAPNPAAPKQPLASRIESLRESFGCAIRIFNA